MKGLLKVLSLVVGVAVASQLLLYLSGFLIGFFVSWRGAGVYRKIVSRHETSFCRSGYQAVRKATSASRTLRGQPNYLWVRLTIKRRSILVRSVFSWLRCSIGSRPLTPAMRARSKYWPTSIPIWVNSNHSPRYHNRWGIQSMGADWLMTKSDESLRY